MTYHQLEFSLFSALAAIAMAWAYKPEFLFAEVAIIATLLLMALFPYLRGIAKQFGNAILDKIRQKLNEATVKIPQQLNDTKHKIRPKMNEAMEKILPKLIQAIVKMCLGLNNATEILLQKLHDAAEDNRRKCEELIHGSRPFLHAIDVVFGKGVNTTIFGVASLLTFLSYAAILYQLAFVFGPWLFYYCKG